MRVAWRAAEAGGRVVRCRGVRPRSILLFERLFLSTLAIAIVQAAAGWDELVRRAEAEGRGPLGVAAVIGLTLFTMGALVLLVSRGRLRWAKWLLVVLCAIGVPFFLAGLAAGKVAGWEPLALVQAALQVASLGFLFTREARDWLKAGG